MASPGVFNPEIVGPDDAQQLETDAGQQCADLKMTQRLMFQDGEPKNRPPIRESLYHFIVNNYIYIYLFNYLFIYLLNR